MGLRKIKKSFLDRAENAILEHIPEKYQKAVVDVYRLGFSMNIIGIFGMILLLFSIISIFIVKDSFTIDGLIIRLVLLAATSGLAFLGGRYMKMKLNPPLAFGWALLVGIICLFLTVFFGFILIAMSITPLDAVYGAITLYIIGSIMLLLTTMPLIILVNTIKYLFFAHKRYEKWYKDYAKRHHLGEEVKVAKKSKKENSEYDDGL